MILPAARCNLSPTSPVRLDAENVAVSSGKLSSSGIVDAGAMQLLALFMKLGIASPQSHRMGQSTAWRIREEVDEMMGFSIIRYPTKRYNIKG